MKYVIAALVVCLLVGTALLVFSTLRGTTPIPSQVSPAQESAVNAPEPSPEEPPAADEAPGD